MSKKKKKVCYSGIGGQAVMEGIMMRNKNRYSVAVRKSDKTIEVMTSDCKSGDESVLRRIPFIRGIFAFVDSLVLGMSTLEYSSKFYEEDEEPTKFDKLLANLFGSKAEKIVDGVTIILAIVFAVGIFFVLPYVASYYLGKVIVNDSLIAIAEGLIRLLIFIIYILLISFVKDIKRTFMYHGAEHKCINCIEKGKPLTVKNVMRSSRKHRRCGTSFLLIIMIITIILFFFIRVDTIYLKVGLRILLIPVIAGISYEVLRIMGKFDNGFIKVLSAPGLWLQSLTTKEPTEDMCEVAIKAVEAVFDWKEYLSENFDYKESGEDDGWLDDEEEDGK